MKHASIVIVHYSKPDDFGGKRAVLATKTRSQLLRDSLTSLFESLDYPTEVIVMDNGGNPDDTEYLTNLVREGKVDTLVRYKNNMNFAFAWNQGFRISTGDFVCFTCNDIYYEKGWLSECIKLMEKYSDRKLISAPFITRDKDNKSYNKEVLEDARINSLAGSTCFIIRPEDFKEIGEVAHHRVGGSIWHRRMCKKGYQVIVPLQNKGNHMGHRAGTDFTQHVEIERVLLSGDKVNFTYTYEEADKDYYYGKQKPAGQTI